MKNQASKFEELLHYRYRITWKSGIVDVLEPNDLLPLTEALEHMAIIPLVPVDIKDPYSEDGIKYPEKPAGLVKLMAKMNIQTHEVTRESLNGHMEPDGLEQAPCILIENMKEEEAKRLAENMGQDYFVYFYMSTFQKIDLVGCGKFAGKRIAFQDYEI
jgi:hypothetical protein